MDPRGDIRITVDPVEATRCSRCKKEIDVKEVDPFSTVVCPACGMEQIVPARFGSFLLLNLINAGGMGCVYLAKDESLGRMVAIKVMLSSLGEDLDFVESFKREAQAAAKLNHPNIAQIYSFGQERGQPYIVMELVSGQRFDKLIADSSPLEQVFVLKVGAEIAEGLRAADEIGLVHGDIKPENILLDEKMNAKLVDFGIATFSAEHRQPDGVWGTPYYIAPEKVRRQKIDARADIYSLGATLYHALAGKPPFDGATSADVVRARLEKEAPLLRSVRPDIDPAVEGIVRRMLESQPSLRYPTYASLLGDLLEVLRSFGLKKGTPTGPRMRRVVIKKKGSGSTTDEQPGEETQRPESGSQKPAGRLVIRKGIAGRVAMDTVSAATAEPVGRKAPAAKGKGCRAAALVVSIVGLIALGVGGWFWQQHRRQIDSVKIEQRRQYYELQQTIEKAGKLLKSVQSAAAEVILVSMAFRPHIEAGEKLASSVFGESLAEMGRKADPPPPPPVPEPATNAVTSTNSAGQALSATPAPPAPETPQATPAPETPPSAPAVEELPDKTKLREVLVSVNRASKITIGKVDFVRELKEAAEETAKACKLITTNEIAAEYVAEMEQYLAAARPLKMELHKSLSNVGALVEQARLLRSSLDRILDQQRLAEEKHRKEEEYKAKVLTETQLVIDAVAGCKTQIQSMDFAAAHDVIKKQAARLETTEAQAKAKLWVERYGLLAEWKNFLIESINKNPYQWGWYRGRNVYEDILSADQTGLKIRTAAVLWVQVSHVHLSRIVDHYLKNSSLPASVRARQCLATALWFGEVGNAGLAKTYIEKAVTALSTIQREVDRLIPPAAPETDPGTAPPGEDKAATETAPQQGQQ